jgi:hypothetical protein
MMRLFRQGLGFEFSKRSKAFAIVINEADTVVGGAIWQRL